MTIVTFSFAQKNLGNFLGLVIYSIVDKRNNDINYKRKTKGSLNLVV